MTPLQQGRAIVACVVVCGVWSAVLAQRGQGPQGGPMYDTGTEARFVGTVERVETAPGQGPYGEGGLHLELKTATDTLKVHLGPVAFLKQLGVALEKRDAVEILGSRITVDKEVVLLARHVRKGNSMWTLRDESGRPLWSGGRR